jgi:hypothetical protein
MPIRYTLTDFLLFGFVNVTGCYDILKQTVKAAIGVYPTGHLGVIVCRFVRACVCVCVCVFVCVCV